MPGVPVGGGKTSATAGGSATAKKNRATAKKAGGKSSWALATYQPPFDKRILNLVMPDRNGVIRPGGKLQRGYIEPDPQLAINSGGHGVRFLYNPTELTATWGMSDQTQLPTPGGVSNDQGTNNIMGFGNIQFSLLYDRTYETWDRNYVFTPQGQFGVYVDVWQFEKMLGILGPDDVLTLAQTPRGPMVMTPVTVRFGGLNSITMYGVITDFSVTYTHWTQLMVPNRAVVSLGMIMYPYPDRAAILANDQAAAQAANQAGIDILNQAKADAAAAKAAQAAAAAEAQAHLR